MALHDLIPAEEFCAHHRIEYSFIDALQELRLVKIVTVQDKAFIAAEELQHLEKYVRLHYDMDINLQGIEAIMHLLVRIQGMQDEIATLKAKLRLYEREEYPFE